MKAIRIFLTVVIYIMYIEATAQETIFEESFSYVTESWYGNTVLPAEDYDLYFENTGWTGENVVLGSPSATGLITFNDVNKPRISYWKGASDHITTPTIDCSVGVTLSVNLKLCARSNTGITWDFPKANFLHAADGENFEMVSTIDLQHEFTTHSFYVENGTANSKFRFQVFQNSDPNRFFIDSLVIKSGNLLSTVENQKEDNLYLIVRPDNIELKSSTILSQVELFSLTGQSVYKGNTPIINTNFLYSGIYILIAEFEDKKTVAKKFIVNREQK